MHFFLQFVLNQFVFWDTTWTKTGRSQGYYIYEKCIYEVSEDLRRSKGWDVDKARNGLPVPGNREARSVVKNVRRQKVRISRYISYLVVGGGAQPLSLVSFSLIGFFGTLYPAWMRRRFPVGRSVVGAPLYSRNRVVYSASGSEQCVHPRGWQR
jgi:hypothetical protein